jgi:hypothetical protein
VSACLHLLLFSFPLFFLNRHVLTGPDHLSALVTLSVNQRLHASFFLGVRWGIGHSAGLLLVGVILILLDRNDETVNVPEQVSTIFEALVGIFMLLLGAYGIRRAHETRPKGCGNSTIPNLPAVVVTPGDDTIVDEEKDERNSNNVSPYQSYHNHFNVQHVTSPDNVATLDDNEQTNDEIRSCSSCWGRFTKSVSTRTMALGAGIVHGLAGPGGVLGVIPAVQLHDGRLAAVYLGTFCLMSTLTMGVFAILYGSCSSRLAARDERVGSVSYREFVIECLSASLSILVGALWLILLAIGKLDAVFP